MPVPLDPMVPLLTGWLIGRLNAADDHGGRSAMKIAKIMPLGHDGFDVRFASGLVLRVGVTEVQREATEE